MLEIQLGIIIPLVKWNDEEKGNEQFRAKWLTLLDHDYKDLGSIRSSSNLFLVNFQL